uniref:Anthocyanin 5-aromatic acyltransferase n=1 Tax=Oryza punctata TaxID=4537 RepID=A0A0E0LRT4_ORYPU
MAPPPSVTVIEDGRVAVPPPPASGDVSAPAQFKLTALDAQWIPLPLIQRVLVFDGGEGGAIPPFEDVVASLRASLAETVARLLPLAGRIVHLPETGEAAIDCSERGVAGDVRFVVAECDGADAARVAGDVDHDVALMEQLAPVLDADALPAETMAAQVTRLGGGGGGVAVGVALHHAVVDGRSVWRFIEAWAACCRGDDAWSAAPAPAFDRAAVALPDGEELARDVLRKYAPNLPVTTVPQFLVKGRLKHSRRTFTVAAAQMLRLKQRIIAGGGLTASASPPSGFVALASLAWVSFVRSKHATGAIAADDEVYLFFFIDCRGRRAAFDPPVGEGFFGTCISGCLARATARDLLSSDDGGLVAAAKAVQEEVRRAAEDPLAGWEWMALVGRIALDRLVNMSGSTRFPAYEAADFGWGSPSRTELVTMNHSGQVVLVAAKGGGGGVQASVSLHPEHMDKFKSHFESYLG